ncbi:unnamed protein product [Angiostrongylus costaricensis]|uniref:Uncharacterized protein n=1 Tax=Angiostrongylus costaricensis TaxID=334426 RepID=A0A158PFQ5_ANGCS|nr:unnamed protein product [Angiostrongylus costaricensis]
MVIISLIVLFFLITTAVSHESDYLTAKLDHLTENAEQLTRDFLVSQRKFRSKMRSRLIILLLELISTEVELRRLGNPELLEKFDSITLLLQKGMRVNYPKLRQRISLLLTQFIGSTFAPFTIMQAPSANEVEQALFPFEAVPQGRNTLNLSMFNRPSTNPEGSPDIETSSNVPPPERILATREASRDPQLSYLSMELYPQDYESSLTSNYKPAQQRLQLLQRQEQLASQLRLQQLPQQRQSYYWLSYPY